MNPRLWTLLKYFLLWTIAPLLTSIFLVVGAPLLRVLERSYGQTLYWLTGGLVMAISYAFGVMDLFFIFTAIWTTQGLYGLLERHGRAGVTSGLIAITGGVIGFFIGLLVFLGEGFKKFTSDAESALVQLLSDLHMEKAQFLGRDLSPSAIFQLLPSLIGIIVLIGFASSLILDRRIAALINVRFDQVVAHLKLMHFRLPDICLWILLFSALLSFLKLGEARTAVLIQMTALNLFYFLFMAYFFQGLAVFEAAMIFFRVGPFLRILLYILVVGNLFFLLSLLGIADFWLDFRKRMKREKTI